MRQAQRALLQKKRDLHHQAKYRNKLDKLRRLSVLATALRITFESFGKYGIKSQAW